MIAILLVVYQGMVRLGENGRNGEIGCMVGSYMIHDHMCSICTWKVGVKISMMKSSSLVITTSDPFWNSDVTSRFSLPTFPPIIGQHAMTIHQQMSLQFVTSKLFLKNCWDGIPQFFSFLHPTKKNSSDGRFLPGWPEQATPCENIFVPVRLAQVLEEKIG